MPPLSSYDKESAAVDATIDFGGDCYRERTNGDKNSPKEATVTPPMPSSSIRWDSKKTPKCLLLLVGIFFLSIDGIMSSTKSLFRYTNEKDALLSTTPEEEYHKYHQQVRQDRIEQFKKTSKRQQQQQQRQNLVKRQEQNPKQDLTIIAPAKDAVSTTYSNNTTTTTTPDSDSFSACLLIMDDNHFLIEWLAYHYHVMPLRRLIVLSDPKSRTTPLPILERWNGLDLNYSLWSYEDVFPNGEAPKLKPRDDNALTRYRQMHRAFFRECMTTLKDEGRSWVLLTDVDEYTMFNEHVFDTEAVDVDGGNKRRAGNRSRKNKDNNINDQLQQYTSNLKLYASVVNQTKSLFQKTNDDGDTFSSLLSKSNSKHDNDKKALRKKFYVEPGYFWKTVEKYSLKPPYMAHKAPNDVKRSCVPLSRKHFGTIERHETYNMTRNNDGFSGTAMTLKIDNHEFNMSTFSTTNWKEYRKKHKGAGKTMIDVSKVPHETINRKKIMDIGTHRPIPDICTTQGMFLHPKDNIFVVNHYPGTLEQMKFRKDDARGTAGRKGKDADGSTAVDGDGGGNGEEVEENTNVSPQEGKSQASTTKTGDYRTDRYWKSRQLVGRVESTMIEQWLPGFVKNVGIARASKLLADAGDTQKAADGAWV